MDVNIGCGFAHAAQHVEIGVPVIVGMNAALEAHFRRAAIPGFRGPPADFGKVEPVSRTAHGPGTALGKRAEAASVEADIGIINVAVDSIRQRVACRFLTQPVGQRENGQKVLIFRIEQGFDIGFG